MAGSGGGGAGPVASRSAAVVWGLVERIQQGAAVPGGALRFAVGGALVEPAARVGFEALDLHGQRRRGIPNAVAASFMLG